MNRIPKHGNMECLVRAGRHSFLESRACGNGTRQSGMQPAQAQLTRTTDHLDLNNTYLL